MISMLFGTKPITASVISKTVSRSLLSSRRTGAMRAISDFTSSFLPTLCPSLCFVPCRQNSVP
jgi:hypothetical protein